jgi:uncharacterized membrane protein SirB2
MIITLIIIYLVSVIGNYFNIRYKIIKENKKLNFGCFIELIVPIINTIDLLSDIWFRYKLDEHLNFNNFTNWFFKIPKR